MRKISSSSITLKKIILDFIHGIIFFKKVALKDHFRPFLKKFEHGNDMEI